MPEKRSEREICLQQAIEYVTKDRNAQHGNPEDNFGHIAEFWNTYLRAKFSKNDVHWVNLKPSDIGTMMTLMKIARLIKSPGNFDNYVDGCGYLSCAWECAIQEEK